MKLTLLGSLGNIGRLTVPALVKAGHEVTVITTNPKRQTAIKAIGAIPAVGSMADEQFLTTEFTGADAVYLMLSGNAGTDLLAAAKTQAQIFRRAITAAHVHNVVDLSSIGADGGPDVGSLYAYHLIEDELRKLSDVNLAFVRPVGFYSNLYANLPTIRAQHTIFANIPATVQRAWTDPRDIAATVVPLLEATPAGQTVHYVISDHFSGEQLTAALQSALALPDLKYIEISDKQYTNNLLDQGVPKQIAASFVQMSTAQRQPEKFYADLKQHNPTYGKIKLADFVREFTAAYNNPANKKTAATLAERTKK
ncbi:MULTISPECIES: SDR family oxidoreductase [Loigolactobacillus]|uniref:SDR family oxidoreductase n=1 Tax=Loigolactobacillus TaxID=2767889 RepID=UPI000F7EAAD6|nr:MULTISPECIES: NAD(P)H-binding protein [Loigolactobacillus]MDA5388919.1 NAD(P)H-binding protein [Loigolactobacillus backii]MDA5390651.1 NAD(P)H-binding protein [Loigolactobacillus backii]